MIPDARDRKTLDRLAVMHAEWSNRLLCGALGWTWDQATAFLRGLVDEGNATALLSVAHLCEDIPMRAMLYPAEQGAPVLPFKCPNCDDTVTGPNEVETETVYAIAKGLRFGEAESPGALLYTAGKALREQESLLAELTRLRTENAALRQALHRLGRMQPDDLYEWIEAQRADGSDLGELDWVVMVASQALALHNQEAPE